MSRIHHAFRNRSEKHFSNARYNQFCRPSRDSAIWKQTTPRRNSFRANIFGKCFAGKNSRELHTCRTESSKITIHLSNQSMSCAISTNKMALPRTFGVGTWRTWLRYAFALKGSGKKSGFSCRHLHKKTENIQPALLSCPSVHGTFTLPRLLR